MTTLEKIEAVRQVQEYNDDVRDMLELVIRRTYDPDCVEIVQFTVDGATLDVRYMYNCYGELGRNTVKIPIAWLDEDFDYVAAYGKLKSKGNKA